MMKLHYFDQDKADDDDMALEFAKRQGYGLPNACDRSSSARSADDE